jgi:hypothetical protein
LKPVQEFLEDNGNALLLHSETHRLELYAVVVTSAPQKRSKMIKFDLKVKEIDEILQYVEISCSKFNTMLPIDDIHFTTHATDFIQYAIYRCLEDFLKPPFEVVETKFFIYSSNEDLNDKTVDIGLHHYEYYDKFEYYVNDRIPDEDLEDVKFPISSLKCMTSVMCDLLEECKLFAEITEDELSTLEKVCQFSKESEKYLSWPEHRNSYIFTMMFMVIMSKYM